MSLSERLYDMIEEAKILGAMDGLERGIKSGYDSGYDAGLSQGREEGREEIIRAIMETNNVSRERALVIIYGEMGKR